MKRAWPLLLVMLGGCAALRELLKEPPPAGVEAGAIRIPGPEARATGVAFADFTAQVEAETAAARLRAEAEDSGVSPDRLALLQAEWDCYRRPDFYDAWTSLADGGTHFTVQITPRPEVCFGPGEELYGGGASYQIDARTFDILKKEPSE